MPFSRDLCAWQMPATKNTWAVMAERPIRSARVEKMGRSRSWRRSPQPPHRRPPTPPPPPSRCAAPAARVVEEPQPVRRFHRGARAGDRVKASAPILLRQPRPAPAPSAALPLRQTPTSLAVLLVRLPSGLSVTSALRQCRQHALLLTHVDPSSAVQPCIGQVSSSPFFLQPVPQTLPPWLPSWRRRTRN